MTRCQHWEQLCDALGVDLETSWDALLLEVRRNRRARLRWQQERKGLIAAIAETLGWPGDSVGELLTALRMLRSDPESYRQLRELRGLPEQP